MSSGSSVDATLVSVLEGWAALVPDRPVVRFLAKGEELTEEVTFGELAAKVRAAASGLSERCKPGDRVLVMCPPGPDYLVAVLACMYSGVLPVPVYPPAPLVPGRAIGRLRSVISDCGAHVALTVSRLEAVTGQMAGAGLDGVEWLAVDTLVAVGDRDWPVRLPAARSGAFIQYTSGSTADPKGVYVTHDGLRADLRIITHAYGLDEDACVVSWLPPFHDMGLVGCLFTPLWAGFTAVIMPPEAFLRRPLRWLSAISTYRATISPAPNFAYEYAAAVGVGGAIEDLDLSSWRVAINGAEPVRARTLDAFCDVFGSRGFRRDAFYPSWGMAETALLTSTGRLGSSARAVNVDRDALGQGRLEQPTGGADVPSKELVTCGPAPEGTEVVAVNPDTGERCEPGRIGELWVSGPHVAGGYWGRPEQSDERFAAQLADADGTWLRSGDLGCLLDGQVVVTGRLKDLMIVRGANYYPQDFELAMQSAHARLRPECGIAFTIDGDVDEEVVLVQGADIGTDEEGDLDEAARSIVRHVTEAAGLRPDVVLLVKPKHVPRTTSGKVRRSTARTQFLAGELPTLYEWRAAASN